MIESRKYFKEGRYEVTKKTATRTKIIETAIGLFAQKGYSSVKTRELADKAGISEVTLFRYFQSKREIFGAALVEQMHSPFSDALSMEKFTFDPLVDLKFIADLVRTSIEQNSQIIKMNMKDINGLTEDNNNIIEFPQQVKDLLRNYFDELAKKKNVEVDSKLLAIGFLSALFGFLMNHYIINAFSSDISIESVIESYVQMFARNFEK
jgi:TetR/AcrR family transcriptional repressor of mexJK operon